MQFLVCGYDGDDAEALDRRLAVRDAFDRWLDLEPYVVGDVWRRIDITACRVGPSYLPMLGR